LLNSVLRGVKDESGVSPVLPIETSKDEDVSWTDLIAHSQIARDPSIPFSQIDLLPDFGLNIIEFTDISNLLGVKLDSPRKDIDALSIEDTASCRVSGYVEIRYSVPFVAADLIILAIGVKVLSIISSNGIDPIHISIIDSSEITSRVIKQGSVLQALLLFNIL